MCVCPHVWEMFLPLQQIRRQRWRKDLETAAGLKTDHLVFIQNCSVTTRKKNHYQWKTRPYTRSKLVGNTYAVHICMLFHWSSLRWERCKALGDEDQAWQPLVWNVWAKSCTGPVFNPTIQTNICNSKLVTENMFETMMRQAAFSLYLTCEKLHNCYESSHKFSEFFTFSIKFVSLNLSKPSLISFINSKLSSH